MIDFHFHTKRTLVFGDKVVSDLNSSVFPVVKIHLITLITTLSSEESKEPKIRFNICLWIVVLRSILQVTKSHGGVGAYVP